MDMSNDSLIKRSPSRDELIFLLSGVGFIFLGQNLHRGLPVHLRGQSIIFTVLGIILFALAFYSFTRGGPPKFYLKVSDGIGNWLELDRHRLLLLIFAPVLSYGAWLAAGDQLRMHIPWLALVTWLFAIALVLGVSMGRIRVPEVKGIAPIHWIIPLSLFVTALLLRATLLDRIPWVLAGDEASAGISAVEFLEGTWNNLFNTAWYSFPSLYFIFPSVSIGLLGQTIMALRLPSAIAGALTVVALYWYGKKAFGQTTALAASIYLAAFHFHIHFSRIGLNNVWDGLLFVTFSGLIWIAWQEKKKWAFALAGLALAASFYVYASARVIVLMLAIWLFVALLQDRDRLKARLQGLLLLSMVTITAALPLGLYYLKHPDDFMAPLVRVSILGPWLENEVIFRIQPAYIILFDQFKTSALAFTSENLRHWYTIDYPMLLALPATLFLMGLFLLIARLNRLQNLWVGLWILAAIIVGALSESTPAAQRYVFVAPAVALVIGLTIGQLEYWLIAKWPARRNLIFAGLISVIAVGAILDLRFYFGEYSPSKRFSDQNTEVAQSAAKWLSQFDEPVTVYFFGFPRMGFNSIQTLSYLAPQAEGIDIELEVRPAEWRVQTPTVFLFLPERSDDLEPVQAEYPGGEQEIHRSYNGQELFITYTLN